MRKRATALVLLLCLSLTACGGGEAGRGQGLFERASGIPEDTVLLTVDGREVPAWRYLYWLACGCGRLQEQYRSAGVTLDWEAPLEGGTLADYAKDQALADTAVYATVENWAERWGCALDDGDTRAMEDAWAERTAEYGGEEPYLAALADMGLNRVRAEELSGTGRLYAKLYGLCGTEDGPLAPEDAELDAFAAEQGRITVNRILISAGTDREDARRRAEEVFAKLNTAENLAEEFGAMAAAGDDPEGSRTLIPGEGTLDGALEEAALALEAGQCSGILESGEGFSILLREQPDRAALTGAYFDEMLQRAAGNAALQTTEQYEELDVAEFAAALDRERHLPDR